jgi:hypothetical protein
LPEDQAASRSVVMRALVAFGRFWWDFLVGDTPELTVAVIVILGIVALLAKEASTTAAWVVLPLLVIVAYALSVVRGSRSS